MTKLSPSSPEYGTKIIFSFLKPVFFKNKVTSLTISLNLPSLNYYLSILLTATITYLIPNVNANKACSLVYPSDEIPASNSVGAADTTNTATSAYEVPVIIFLMKSLCPGASIIVHLYFLVLNLLREI